ncbi:peptide chain release factor 2 [Candidatus Pelagibacter sp.]|nr:peptide chain release factor 2 [Candidatus Pelagibacter sp.]
MDTNIENYKLEIKKISQRIKEYLEKHNIFSKLDEINKITLDSNFWTKKSRAEKILKEKKVYEDLIYNYEQSLIQFKEAIELYNLALEENNKAVLKETKNNILEIYKSIKRDEIKCFLSKEADILNTYLEIHAGAGGTESQDWAAMLRRMYMKWASSKNYKTQLISEHKGDEAGIKSSTIKIIGNYVYGFLKSESGIHRLVRISPFDSGARRHTSFASVWIYPAIDESIKVDLLEKDLRVDTYRSSGAGGQHVNTTDSAVRITHLPTKLVVQCQSDRSQHKNKETCINMLKARLYEFELKKKEQNIKNTEESKSDIGWGHQIRSYVLHPYRMVKDNRTNFESTNPNKVLDGDIDEFLESSLYKLND